MKHISFFITSLSSGGAEHQLVQLADYLSESGYKVDVVTFADMSDHYKTSESIRRIRIAENKNKFIKLLAIFWFFVRIETDVVISFGQRASLFCLGPLFIRYKIKVICGERNLTVGEPSKTERFLWKYLYKRANWIVPNSFSQGKYIVSRYKNLEPKIKTIINYTDINKYLFSEYSNHLQLQVSLFCRYNKQKNYENFAKAVKRFYEKQGGKMHFDWYGDIHIKDKIYNPDYLKFVEILKLYNLEDVVTLHGKTDQVAQIMKESDAICLPSYFEGFSNTLSEAICCGKIVLASDVSDNSMMVHDGENGFLFDPYDVDDIVKAFVRFVDMKTEQRKEMQKNSRIIAETLFDKNIFVNSYIDLIEH